MEADYASVVAGMSNALTIDSCDPKRMMFDSLDLLAHEIITNPSKRMERKGQLEVLNACTCTFSTIVVHSHRRMLCGGIVTTGMCRYWQGRIGPVSYTHLTLPTILRV